MLKDLATGSVISFVGVGITDLKSNITSRRIVCSNYITKTPKAHLQKYKVAIVVTIE
jgi:hypothetical protein